MNRKQVGNAVMFAAGRYGPRKRAISSLTRTQAVEIRAHFANAAMAAAVDSLLGVAFLYASIARRIDRMTGTKYAMSEAEWQSILSSYSRRAS